MRALFVTSVVNLGLGQCVGVVPIVIDSESEAQRRTVLRQAAVGPSA